MAGKWTQAKLSCDAPKGEVVFDFNPDSIQFNRKKDSKSKEKGSASANAGFPGGSTGMIFAGSEMPEVKLMKLWFDGPKTKKNLELIASWMSPVTGDALAALGKIVADVAAKLSGSGKATVNLAAKLPEVTFTWGTGFKYPCNVIDLRSKYVRFDENGNPTRADVQSITLKWSPKLESFLGTNPTSGGPAGRLSHVMTAGESIPSIAQNRYGSPIYWRALAEENGIDDPLRVRPGEKVYLPNTDEIIRATRG